MNDEQTILTGGEPLQIAMLIYPGMTLLDMAGPQAALGLHGKTHLVWKDMDPVLTDTNVTVLPTATFETCPRELDVLFVPGGFGTWDVMGDEAVQRFLQECAASSKMITSVCTGSIILAAAGLLDGYKAATHWAMFDALEALGVEAVHERVVTDRNRVSGAGVTAGIDFGLTLLAQLRGEDVAKSTQLMLEYDPAPPFDAGSPARAGSETTSAVNGILAADKDRAMTLVREIVGKRATAQASMAEPA